MSFSDLRIRTRILAGFAVLIVGSVFMAIYAANQSRQTAEVLNDIVEQHIARISLTSGLKDNLNFVARAVRNIALAPMQATQAAEKTRLDKASAANTELLTKLDAGPKEPLEQAALGCGQGCPSRLPALGAKSHRPVDGGPARRRCGTDVWRVAHGTGRLHRQTSGLC
jgi:hypothetical protein